jgi:hypothetical protein
MERELSHQQLIEHFPPTPIPGTDLTTHQAWLQVLDQLEGTLSSLAVSSFLKPSVLARCTGEDALIVAPDSWRLEQLTQRLYHHIERTLNQVLGRSMTCAYMTFAQVLQTDDINGPPAPTGEVTPAASPNGATPGAAVPRRRGRPPKNRPVETGELWTAHQNAPQSR